MLQQPGAGCQLSCSSVNPPTRFLAVWSFALRSVARRRDQAGANVSCDAIVRTLLDYKLRPRRQLPGPLGFQLSWCVSAADGGRVGGLRGFGFGAGPAKANPMPDQRISGTSRMTPHPAAVRLRDYTGTRMQNRGLYS